MPCCCAQGNASEDHEPARLALQHLELAFSDCSASQWAGIVSSLQAIFPASVLSRCRCQRHLSSGG